MDENLIGYLLDALDPATQRAVEAHLRAHPEAQTRLAALRGMLAPLAADAEAPEPPHGLARSALARIAGRRPDGLPSAPPPSPRQVGGPSRRGLRRADLVAAAVLLLATAGMAGPWLVRQWHDARILACQNNLYQFWGALQRYSDQHPDARNPDRGGAFPLVEEHGPRNFAGVFVVELNDAGVLSPDASVACPGQGRRPPPAISRRDLEEMARSQPEKYDRAVRDLGGDYAYSLGYREGETLFGLRRDSGDRLPILADRPRPDPAGNSPNHGGGGQNVLYIGGQVRWCVDRTVGVDRDDIYLNVKNQLLAGENPFDTVLGPSDAAP